MSIALRNAFVFMLTAVVVGFAMTIIVALPAKAAASSSIFGTAVPATISDADKEKVELGVEFKARVPGKVVGIRFYKGTLNSGTHSGSLWSGNKRMATARFTSESSSGWQQVTFGIPYQFQPAKSTLHPISPLMVIIRSMTPIRFRGPRVT